MLGLQYHLSHDVPIIRARAFNHIGPGQNTRFALPNFAQQIAAIERGEQDPVIHVGDLTPRRDFTDVRDVVKAYTALLQHGHNGEAYNVCRGENHAIGDLLNQLCAMSTHDIDIQQDPSRLRPLDVSEILGDNQKLRQHTGWQPSIAIQASLQDILQNARRKTESDHIS
jgi:GDP-4-dehydro-6-deoxy-D-mannose reductase